MEREKNLKERENNSLSEKFKIKIIKKIFSDDTIQNTGDFFITSNLGGLKQRSLQCWRWNWYLGKNW